MNDYLICSSDLKKFYNENDKFNSFCRDLTAQLINCSKNGYKSLTIGVSDNFAEKLREVLPKLGYVCIYNRGVMELTIRWD